MVEINTAVDSLENTGVSPYEVPSDVQANPEDYGGPYTDMIGLLKQISVYLDRLANTPAEMREQPRATQVDLSSTPYQNTLQLRTTLIVITASAAAAVTLYVGTSAYKVYQFSGPDTRVFPLITAIGAGVDLSVSASAGTATAYLIAYPMG